MSSFRRRLMMAQGGGGSPVPGVKESEVGDICVYDVNKGSLAIIKSAEWSASKYPIVTYVPIGVVVVPASHGHYEGGKCAIMSLNYMNCDTPQQGGDMQNMVWGVSSDINTIPNLNKIPYVGIGGDVSSVVIGEVSNSAYLPSDDDSFTSVQNPYDNKTKYHIYSNYYTPSPYNNDGTFNTEYSRITSPSSTSNCLSDFDGYNNTKKIIEVRGNKDYSTWKPNSNNRDDYPAASCCDMYFTQGTKQGDWYLPATGEIGYVIVRLKNINTTIDNLIESGFITAKTIDKNPYWSSTEINSNNVRGVNFNGGDLGYGDSKGYVYQTLAFKLV